MDREELLRKLAEFEPGHFEGGDLARVRLRGVGHPRAQRLGVGRPVGSRIDGAPGERGGRLDLPRADIGLDRNPVSFAHAAAEGLAGKLSDKRRAFALHAAGVLAHLGDLSQFNRMRGHKCCDLIEINVRLVVSP